jgi:hypothetical protein
MEFCGRSWAVGPPAKHERVVIVMMAGSDGSTVNFWEYNRQGGCFMENGKRKTENFSQQGE